MADDYSLNSLLRKRLRVEKKNKLFTSKSNHGLGQLEELSKSELVKHR